MSRILVIDDDADCVEIISIRLSRQGHEVLTAPDGPSGLLAAAREKPDAILLDVRMPTMDGLRVLEILRDNEPTKGTPILIVSALDVRTLAPRLPEDSLTRLIEKPLDFDLLDARLDELRTAARLRA